MISVPLWLERICPPMTDRLADNTSGEEGKMSNFKRVAIAIAAVVAVALPSTAVAASGTVDNGAANGLRIVAKAKANGL